jgi:tetratricopeptide (TPR) repeat protein
MICLAEGHRLNGEIEKALDLANRGLAITKGAKSSYGVGWSQRALGRIALTRGALSEAETHLNEALQIFHSLQARYDLGRAHLDLAALAHAQGKLAEVAMHLGEAHRLFTSSRVPKYVERTKQLAKAFGVVLSGEPPDDLSGA